MSSRLSNTVSASPHSLRKTHQGLVFVPRTPIPETLRHSLKSLSTAPINYSETLKILSRFRKNWKQKNHTEEPLFVWITHPKNHTRLNLSHFFSRGFSAPHCLFLESLTIERTLSLLLQDNKRISAIVLDGYPKDRVVLHLARKWTKPITSSACLKADEFALLAPLSQRLFVIGQ